MSSCGRTSLAWPSRPRLPDFRGPLRAHCDAEIGGAKRSARRCARGERTSAENTSSAFRTRPTVCERPRPPAWRALPCDTVMPQAGPADVVLAHDYLLVMRGAERTFATIADLYEQAPIFTLLFDEALGTRFEGH